MNKYQSFIINNILEFRFCDGNNPDMNQCEIDESLIKLKQSDDITITKYMLMIGVGANESIEQSKIKIEYCEDGKWVTPTNDYEGEPIINFDFENPIKTIRFSSIDAIFDTFEMNVVPIFADKEAYYAKLKAEEETRRIEEQKALNDMIKPEHNVGMNLVNIYWNKVNDKVTSVNVSLYMISKNENRPIGNYKESDATFKSITGLAYGSYYYKIIELDSLGNEIAKTQDIKFYINEPERFEGHLCVI